MHIMEDRVMGLEDNVAGLIHQITGRHVGVAANEEGLIDVVLVAQDKSVCVLTLKPGHPVARDPKVFWATEVNLLGQEDDLNRRPACVKYDSQRHHLVIVPMSSGGWVDGAPIQPNALHFCDVIGASQVLYAR
jgi:hypothetical protein